MAGARGCFNCGGCAWCFCVATVVVSPCVQTHVPTPLFPPPFLVHGAVLTGTANFFFYKLLYIDRAQSKLLSKNNVVCIMFVSKKQSDIRLRTAQRRGHQLGKDSFLLGSDDLIA
jgi:hypothetical protein